MTKVIAAIYCSRGTIFITVRRPTGTIMAPPMPWITREAISSFSVSERAHRMDPRVNNTMALKNTRCTPNRSANQPLAGSITATVST
ncbi:hypothetical protein D3C76_1706310 [compost metagenome]